jgi:Fe-S-cluster containining protein
MSVCETCPMEEKLLQCCGKFPMTGNQADTVGATGAAATACPHLTPAGLCRIYQSRPAACREFFCDPYRAFARTFSITSLV